MSHTNNKPHKPGAKHKGQQAYIVTLSVPTLHTREVIAQNLAFARAEAHRLYGRAVVSVK